LYFYFKKKTYRDPILKLTRPKNGSRLATHRLKTTALEDCSVTYFAGYLAYKCIKKFNCHFCQNIFLTSKDLNEKNQILLINKNYSSFENNNTGLKAPSISFNEIINHSLDIFENYSFKNKLRFKLMQKIKVDVLINQWLNDGNDCNCKNISYSSLITY